MCQEMVLGLHKFFKKKFERCPDLFFAFDLGSPAFLMGRARTLTETQGKLQ